MEFVTRVAAYLVQKYKTGIKPLRAKSMPVVRNASISLKSIQRAGKEGLFKKLQIFPHPALDPAVWHRTAPAVDEPRHRA